MLEDPSTLAPFIREFGLPLAILAFFFFALNREWIVMGSAHRYTEARRQEERTARIAAEERLDRATSAQVQQAELQSQQVQLLGLVAGRDEPRSSAPRRRPSRADRAADR